MTPLNFLRFGLASAEKPANPSTATATASETATSFSSDARAKELKALQATLAQKMGVVPPSNNSSASVGSSFASAAPVGSKLDVEG
jgi:hypothetical protein